MRYSILRLQETQQKISRYVQGCESNPPKEGELTKMHSYGLEIEAILLSIELSMRNPNIKKEYGIPAEQLASMLGDQEILNEELEHYARRSKIILPQPLVELIAETPQEIIQPILIPQG